MRTIKTAISIEKTLFEQVNDIARELKMSRSRVFALAAREYIQHYENQKLLDAINAAYDDIPDENEEILQSRMRAGHLKIVKDKW